MDAPPLPAEADELYALAPGEFTAARNTLVKQLRAEKRRDEAEAVKALRRPSVPAWAINQVARTDADALERLFDAGATVAAAQRRALSGVRDAGLREASAQRRERIDEVWKVAAQILRDAGIEPQAHRQPISATLEAASADADMAELVRQGRLTADLAGPSGFGDVFGLSLVPDADDDVATDDEAEQPSVEQPAAKNTAAARKARARAAEALAAAAQEATATARRAAELRERAAERRRLAVRSAAEADRLERRAAQARATATEEAAQAEDLEADADAAERAAQKAHEAADVLRREVGDAD
jgi:hypothetical protein